MFNECEEQKVFWGLASTYPWVDPLAAIENMQGSPHKKESRAWWEAARKELQRMIDDEMREQT